MFFSQVPGTGFACKVLLRNLALEFFRVAAPWLYFFNLSCHGFIRFCVKLFQDESRRMGRMDGGTMRSGMAKDGKDGWIIKVK
jgi:hypothetical protein